jgi:hypothetical protein
VTSATERPLLFLDVDGPLIPFGLPGRPRAAATDASGNPPDASGNPLLARLDPGIGSRLTALGRQLVWATTWMEEANEVVSPRIGLPRLPLVQWPASYADEGPRGLHWKTRRLVEWANLPNFALTGWAVNWADASRRHP